MKRREDNALYKILLIFIISNCCNYVFADNNSIKYSKEIRLLQECLKNIKSVAIQFEQNDLHNAFNITGTLVISKPKKFLCNYYPPYPLVIVGNSRYISIYDYELKQLYRIKENENAFNFLLLNEVPNIQKFLIDVKNDANYKSCLTYKFSDIKLNRSILIRLNKKMNLISDIIITEPNGNIIEIKFIEYCNISNVDPGLFAFKNSTIQSAQQKRFSKEELENKYKIIDKTTLPYYD